MGRQNISDMVLHGFFSNFITFVNYKYTFVRQINTTIIGVICELWSARVTKIVTIVIIVTNMNYRKFYP